MQGTKSIARQDELNLSAGKVGKKELLLWISNFRPLSEKDETVEFCDLKGGDLFLDIFQQIWPKAMTKRAKSIVYEPRSEADIQQNWRLIETILSEVNIPTSFFDRQGIQSGKFRSCFQSLVLLYFLHTLVQKHECTFTIVHPIDPKLKNFMSSEAPLNCLVNSGSVSLFTNENGKRSDSVSAKQAFLPIADRSCANIYEENSPNHTCSEQKQSQHAKPSNFCDKDSFSNNNGSEKQRLYQFQPTTKQWDDSELDMKFAAPSNMENTNSSSNSLIGGIFSADGTFTTNFDKADSRKSDIGKNEQHKDDASNAIILDGLNLRQSLPSYILGPGSVSLNEEDLQRRKLAMFPSSSVECQTDSFGDIFGNSCADAPLETIRWNTMQQKRKGDQVIESLRLQNKSLQLELSQLREEKKLTLWNASKQIEDIQEAARIESERLKEQQKLALLKAKHEHTSEIQSVYSHTAEKIKQLEEDVSLAFEMRSSHNKTNLKLSGGALDKQENEGFPSPENMKSMLQMQKILQQRLNVKVQENEVLYSKLRELGANIDQIKIESATAWQEWAQIESIKASIHELSIPSSNSICNSSSLSKLFQSNIEKVHEEMTAFFKVKEKNISSVSPMEKNLIKMIVDLANQMKIAHLQQAQQENATQLLSYMQSSGTNEICSTQMMNELERQIKLENDYIYVKKENARLSKINSYLRQKVDHLEAWDLASSSNGKQETTKNLSDFLTATKGGSVTEQEPENYKTCEHETSDISSVESISHYVPSSSMNDKDEETQRDATLLSILEELGKDSGSVEYCAETKMQQNNNDSSNEGYYNRPILYNNTKRRFYIAESTKILLLQLIWRLFGDFHRYKKIVEISSNEIKRLHNEAIRLMETNALSQEAYERLKTESVESLRKKLSGEQLKWQKQLGITRVQLQVYQQSQTEFKKKLEMSKEETAKAMQACHESEAKKFKNLLEQLHKEDTKNKILSAKEMLWKELVKALSSQLKNPSISHEEEIQSLWAQITGASLLEVSPKSPASLELKNLVDSEKVSKAKSNTGQDNKNILQPKRRTSNENRGAKANKSSSTTSTNTGNSSRFLSEEKSAVDTKASDQPIPNNETMQVDDGFLKCLDKLSRLLEEQPDQIDSSSKKGRNYFYVNAAIEDSNTDEHIFNSHDEAETSALWINFLKSLNDEAVSSLKLQLQMKEEQTESLQKEHEEVRSEATINLMKLTDATALTIVLTEKNQLLQNELDCTRKALSAANLQERSMRVTHRKERELWRKCCLGYKSLFQDIQVRLYLTKMHSPDHCKECVFVAMLTDNSDWTNQKSAQLDAFLLKSTEMEEKSNSTTDEGHINGKIDLNAATWLDTLTVEDPDTIINTQQGRCNDLSYLPNFSQQSAAIEKQLSIADSNCSVTDSCDNLQKKLSEKLRKNIGSSEAMQHCTNVASQEKLLQSAGEDISDKTAENHTEISSHEHRRKKTSLFPHTKLVSQELPKGISRDHEMYPPLSTNKQLQNFLLPSDFSEWKTLSPKYGPTKSNLFGKDDTLLESKPKPSVDQPLFSLYSKAMYNFGIDLQYPYKNEQEREKTLFIPLKSDKSFESHACGSHTTSENDLIEVLRKGPTESENTASASLEYITPLQAENCRSTSLYSTIDFSKEIKDVPASAAKRYSSKNYFGNEEALYSRKLACLLAEKQSGWNKKVLN